MELINLQRISSISIASQLWEQPDIKLLIKKLFTGETNDLEEIWLRYFPKTNNDQSIESSNPLSKIIESAFLRVRIKNPTAASDKRYKNFQIIIYSVLQNLETIRLPFKLKSYCQDAVGELGEKIYKWIEHVTNKLKLEYEFAAMIYWTPYGTIDERKIMTIWENDKSFQRKNISKPELLLMLGCINPQDDFNEDNIEEMEKFLKIHYPDLDLSIYDDKIHAIVVLFIRLYTHSFKKRKPCLMLMRRNPNHSKYVIKPSEMFRECAEAGLINATSYFWNRVQDEQLLLETCRNFFFRLKSSTGKSIEQLIFLIDQLLPEQRNQFIEMNAIEWFRLIMPLGPYNDYIFQLLDNYLIDFQKSDYENLLMHEILERMKDDELSFMKIRHYNLVFEKILAGMPADDKNEFLRKNSVTMARNLLLKLPFNELIFELIDNFIFFDISISTYQSIIGFILKLLQDGNATRVRLDHIHLVFMKIFADLPVLLKDEIFNSYYFHENFKFYDEEFLNVILCNMDRNHRLKLFKKIPFRAIFLGKDGNMEHLDQFMNHVLIDDYERSFYKDYLLGNIESLLWGTEFETVDKILDYFSSSNEERAILKNKINPLEFCKGFIKSSWRYDRAEKFLRWMYPNEEERDAFRNSLEADWFIRERTRENWNEKLELVMQPRRDLRDDYYKFFFGYPEEIDYVYNGEDFYVYRQKLGEHFVEIYGTQSRFWQYKNISELPDIFMKWVSKDEDRRNAINRSYRDDKERILFCKIIEALLSLNNDEDLAFCRKVRLASGSKLASRR